MRRELELHIQMLVEASLRRGLSHDDIVNALAKFADFEMLKRLEK